MKDQLLNPDNLPMMDKYAKEQLNQKLKDELAKLGLEVLSKAEHKELVKNFLLDSKFALHSNTDQVSLSLTIKFYPRVKK